MKDTFFMPNIRKTYWLVLTIVIFMSCESKQPYPKLQKPAHPSENTTTDVPEHQHSDPGSGTYHRNDVLSELESQEIVYTKHARCRMGCRHINENEVMDALEHGQINNRKSDANDQPCPTYAVETRSPDGQLIRIVFADCGEVTKVITVIDLETDFSCNCK